MCWDERTSWTTLAVGTTLNSLLIADLLRRNAYLESILILNWQFGLLMQIPEALIWRSNGHNESAIRLAFWLNILQPVFSFVTLFPFMSKRSRMFASAIVGIYLGYVVIKLNAFDTNFINDSCPHVSLVWWNDKRALLLYFVTSVAIMMTIPSPFLRNLMLALFFTSFAITQTLYPCSYGSMWCWSIAVAGVLTYAFVRAHGSATKLLKR